MLHPIRTGARERLYARCFVRLTYLRGKSLAQWDGPRQTAAAWLGVELEASPAQWKKPQIVGDVGGIHGFILWGMGAELTEVRKAGTEGAIGNGKMLVAGPWQKKRTEPGSSGRWTRR